jgi:hypothetical protein
MARRLAVGFSADAEMRRAAPKAGGKAFTVFPVKFRVQPTLRLD